MAAAAKTNGNPSAIITSAGALDISEQALKVKIEKVNVLNGMGKLRRIGRLSGKKPDWKKAIVTMKVGEKLEIFEGV